MPNLIFWSSYLYVAMMGLIGSIYISYLIKKAVADRVRDYEESSRWGVLSDILMYPILLIYAVATYTLSTFS
jgi:hypothetical protein